MLKILTVVGARPQFIKAAAISHAVRHSFADRVGEDLLHTGQHYDDAMSARFFRELDIPAPRYNLGVGSGSHGAQTAAMLKGIEEVLLAESYDAVLVYGDTNSTLAGAIAAAKLGVPVMHVEAGLRSFNRSMPEELNRVLTDHASTLLFAPTHTAVQNLWNEGFERSKVILCGDVMFDNVLRYAPSAKNHDPGGSEEVLLTVHRNFNTDSAERLTSILSGVENFARAHGVGVLFPVHPRTRQYLDNMAFGHIRLVEPLSYLETLAVLQRVRLVLTDSGGLQKEAFFSGRPCVVLRDETEWTEIVGCGAAVLSGARAETIAGCASRMWNVEPQKTSLFGNGHAAEAILQKVVDILV